MIFNNFNKMNLQVYGYTSSTETKILPNEWTQQVIQYLKDNLIGWNQNMKWKRLGREINQIKNKYNIRLTLTDDKKNFYINFIKFNIQIYVFKDYPFKTPTMYIGKTNYINTLSISDKNILSEINKKLEKKIKCLCCSTILCPNNWFPSNNILNIVDEYFYYKKIIQDARIKLYMIPICNYYKMPKKIIEKINYYLY